MLLLAGDIGGTKAILSLGERLPDRAQPKILAQKRYLCAQYPSLEAIIQDFLGAIDLNQPVLQACFGLPGPVGGRQVSLTNLPWRVDADHIEQFCSVGEVSFVNDFFAAARGVEAIEPSSCLSLYPASNPGSKPDQYSDPEAESTAGLNGFPSGNRLVIGAGTGLGVAPVFHDGELYAPVASEAGHFEFAPVSETQQLLLRWLLSEWQHVSFERLLSGPGIERLHRFFSVFALPNSFVDTPEPDQSSTETIWMSLSGPELAEQISKSPQPMYTAVQVYEAAERGEPAAVKALTEFVSIYGAFVGAAALFWHAPGGIYLAGGIAAKMPQWLKRPNFLRAYLCKGRMSEVVAAFPVYVVLDEELGLKGAMQQNLLSLSSDNAYF